MNNSRPRPPPVFLWLLSLALACLLAIVGLEFFFDNLQDRLADQSANERARLFVGEEIVRSISGIEKDLYRMTSASNTAGLQRTKRSIDGQLAKLRHDLAILKEGGTVRREILLNIEGRDEMVREATYQPDAGDRGYVMELIEIEPLLDEIGKLESDLETLLQRLWTLDERGDSARFHALHGELDVLIKHIPPYFQRLDENANRLFFDSSKRLRTVESELAIQGSRLKLIEIGLIAVVLFLAGILSIFFVKRLNAANSQLAAALAEMEAAKEAAERASQAKSVFVSRMSHELRTPLNAIIGFAELLHDEPLGPSPRNYVELINSSGKHLLELINAVLDHAKIEAGGMTLEKIPFDLPETLASVRSIINDRASAKELDFAMEVAADLPQRIIGDPTRLRQILINLLNNAVKFTERGEVRLRAYQEDGRIVFCIRDTGIGMDAETLSRLFRPFSQADDSVTRRFGGTGLGLTISRDLAEAMGGHIEVTSQPGSGSAFTVRLPLHAATGDASRQPAESATAGDIRLSGRILLVDDNKINLQLGGAMLKRLGLEFETAENGEDALRMLAGGDYSLVLMDMEMPVMDGVTATRFLRDEEARKGTPRLPVIAMTANALKEDRERCLDSGMDGFVAKPISQAALRGELLRLLGQAGTDSATPVTASGDTPASPLFDRKAALFMLDEDTELFEQLAAMFVADLPRNLADIDAALADDDSERLARVAHTLKGLCLTFAAAGPAEAANALEQTARIGDLAACRELAAAARSQIEALSAELAS